MTVGVINKMSGRSGMTVGGINRMSGRSGMTRVWNCRHLGTPTKTGKKHRHPGILAKDRISGIQ